MNKWDERLLGLAEYVSTWSKDPSTKVGAVIAKGNRIVSLGFNGFPSGVGDHPERYADRDTKLAMVLHAEENALLFARQDLTGCTAYVWPMPPCANCAAKLIQAGIGRVVAPYPTTEQAERWGKGFEISAKMFQEAGVILCRVELPTEPSSGVKYYGADGKEIKWMSILHAARGGL